jgi:monofunctional biosynthetic peptidoglycan transglycosylase
MFSRCYVGQAIKIEREFVDYESVNPNLYRAIIASEDARFFRHSGIDWKAVENARKYNERHRGKRKHGASTISMQTAKNVFLTHHRNYVRKGVELIFTYAIEFIWGKKRILEVYVNSVEWGTGVYGVKMASQKYFGKTPDKLTKNECALLAAVLPNPRRWSPAKPTKYINKRVRSIRKRMNGISLPK